MPVGGATARRRLRSGRRPLLLHGQPARPRQTTIAVIPPGSSRATRAPREAAILALRNLEALVEERSPPAVVWLDGTDELPGPAPRWRRAVLLGLDGGEPRFALDLTRARRGLAGRAARRTGGASPRCGASRPICPRATRRSSPMRDRSSTGTCAIASARSAAGVSGASQRRRDARLRGLRRGALPARRPGGDRARHRAAIAACWSSGQGPARLHLHLHCRLHGARRDGRGSRPPRGLRRIRRGGRRPCAITPRSRGRSPPR